MRLVLLLIASCAFPARQDEALAFDFTSNVIIPALRRAGVNATFHPFEGLHSIPDSVLTGMLDAVLPR